ncbi:hypothetical protein [Prevotella pallens]|uniref:hypothetical protein n=1 Tax=Prevotella pallens TaxID=60133 RepID=UPI0028D6360B|nr:hypothetical protein [Prevotella pallens]
MNNPQIHHIHQRNTQRTIRKYTTPTNETRNEHPDRRRGRFIAPVSLHYKIHIFTLLNTCICSIVHTFSYHISWVYTNMWAR